MAEVIRVSSLNRYVKARFEEDIAKYLNSRHKDTKKK